MHLFSRMYYLLSTHPTETGVTSGVVGLLFQYIDVFTPIIKFIVLICSAIITVSALVKVVKGWF